MKYLVWGVAALIVVVVLVLAGGYYFMGHYKVDFNDPQTASKFRENFTKTCVANYQSKMSKAGTPATDDQMSKIGQVCDCARDPVIAALAKRPSMTAMEMIEVMQADTEIAGITKGCSDQFGLTTP
jgi:hypothetical protein